MDKFSDILSTFFVSEPAKKQSTKPSHSHSKFQQSVNDGARNAVNTFSSSSESKETVESKQSIESKQSVKSNQSVESKESVKSKHSDESNQSVESSDLEEFKDDTSTESLANSDTSVSETVEPTFQPKKYTMRAIDIYKKNTLIFNNSTSENIKILSDILHSLSLMTGVSDIYNNSIYILSANDNRPLYKEMLLDNPYLHFTDLFVKSALSRGKLEDIAESPKRTILIVDRDAVQDDKYLTVGDNSNVHLIILTTSIDQVPFLYGKLGANKLAIHVKDKLKSLQQVFYKKVLVKLCSGLSDVPFQTFFDVINQQNFGVRYLMVKNSEMRYC